MNLSWSSLLLFSLSMHLSKALPVLDLLFLFFSSTARCLRILWFFLRGDKSDSLKGRWDACIFLDECFWKEGEGTVRGWRGGKKVEKRRNEEDAAQWTNGAASSSAREKKDAVDEVLHAEGRSSCCYVPCSAGDCAACRTLLGAIDPACRAVAPSPVTIVGESRLKSSRFMMPWLLFAFFNFNGSFIACDFIFF